MLDRHQSMSGLLNATEGVQLVTIGNEAEAPESPFVVSTNGHAHLKPGGGSTTSLDANIPEEYRKESKLFPLASLNPPTSSFSSEGGGSIFVCILPEMLSRVGLENQLAQHGQCTKSCHRKYGAEEAEGAICCAGRSFSVRGCFLDSTVLLTGATGEAAYNIT